MFGPNWQINCEKKEINMTRAGKNFPSFYKPRMLTWAKQLYYIQFIEPVRVDQNILEKFIL